MYKFLRSASVFSGTILEQTKDSIRAKGELIKNNVDVFAKTPEPEPQAIGNTALVTPKLTAEADFQNRYETPMGYGVGNGGSGSGSASYDGDLRLVGDAVKEQCWNFFTKTWGITPIAAAVFMGNITQESNFDQQ